MTSQTDVNRQLRGPNALHFIRQNDTEEDFSAISEPAPDPDPGISPVKYYRLSFH
jgi:hypothetical protein